MTDPTPPTTGADDTREALAPTPSTDEIRFRVEHDWEPYGDGSFDRWLTAHVAAVVAEKTAEVERLTREATAQFLNATSFKNQRDQALGVVAAVKALVESARQQSMRGEPGSVSDLGLSILDVLEPVSGAVECPAWCSGGHDPICTPVWGSCVPSAHHDGGHSQTSGAVQGAGDGQMDCYEAFCAAHGHRIGDHDFCGRCGAPVAEHEQEVRAETLQRPGWEGPISDPNVLDAMPQGSVAIDDVGSMRQLRFGNSYMGGGWTAHGNDPLTSRDLVEDGSRPVWVMRGREWRTLAARTTEAGS